MERVEPTGEPMLISTSAPSEGDDTLNINGSGNGGSAKRNSMQPPQQSNDTIIVIIFHQPRERARRILIQPKANMREPIEHGHTSTIALF